jgi:hypothetical protein
MTQKPLMWVEAGAHAVHKKSGACSYFYSAQSALGEVLELCMALFQQQAQGPARYAYNAHEINISISLDNN